MFFSLFFFVFKSSSLCLVPCLPLSLFEHTIVISLHGQNLNLAANENNIFIRILFYCDHANDALYIFNFDILFHIVTPMSFYLALCCILHLSTQSFVMIL